jgi:hypothetical protein
VPPPRDEEGWASTNTGHHLTGDYPFPLVRKDGRDEDASSSSEDEENPTVTRARQLAHARGSTSVTPDDVMDAIAEDDEPYAMTGETVSLRLSAMRGETACLSHCEQPRPHYTREIILHGTLRGRVPQYGLSHDGASKDWLGNAYLVNEDHLLLSTQSRGPILDLRHAGRLVLRCGEYTDEEFSSMLDLACSGGLSGGAFCPRRHFKFPFYTAKEQHLVNCLVLSFARDWHSRKQDEDVVAYAQRVLDAYQAGLARADEVPRPRTPFSIPDSAVEFRSAPLEAPSHWIVPPRTALRVSVTSPRGPPIPSPPPSPTDSSRPLHRGPMRFANEWDHFELAEQEYLIDNEPLLLLTPLPPPQYLYDLEADTIVEDPNPIKIKDYSQIYLKDDQGRHRFRRADFYPPPPVPKSDDEDESTDGDDDDQPDMTPPHVKLARQQWLAILPQARIRFDLMSTEAADAAVLGLATSAPASDDGRSFTLGAPAASAADTGASSSTVDYSAYHYYESVNSYSAQARAATAAGTSTSHPSFTIDHEGMVRGNSSASGPPPGSAPPSPPTSPPTSRSPSPPPVAPPAPALSPDDAPPFVPLAPAPSPDDTFGPPAVAPPSPSPLPPTTPSSPAPPSSPTLPSVAADPAPPVTSLPPPAPAAAPETPDSTEPYEAFVPTPRPMQDVSSVTEIEELRAMYASVQGYASECLRMINDNREQYRQHARTIAQASSDALRDMTLRAETAEAAIAAVEQRVHDER